MGRSFEKSLAWQKRAEEALVGGGQPHKRSQPPKPIFGLCTNSDDEKQQRFHKTFYEATLDGGLYLPEGHIWFMSMSHTDEDIAKTLNVSEDALKHAKTA